MSALCYGYHEGNRGEYFAQYFLSALGVSAPVIRQSDIGIDFFCALAEKEHKKLTFHSPFAVQHGAKSKKHKYWGDRLKWLFSQELPIFICVTDRPKGLFRLYSTSAMWLARYYHGDEITELVFRPNSIIDPREALPKKTPEGTSAWYHCEIPIGHPIVEFSGFDSAPEVREKAIAALKIAVQLERRNLVFRNLKVHSALWFKNPRPNDPASLEDKDMTVAWNDEPGQNVKEQIEALRDVTLPLALNLNAQNATAQLGHLAPVFSLFSTADIPTSLLAKLPDSVRRYIRN